MGSIWLSPSEIAALPTSGAAWDVVKSKANGSFGTADIHDSNYVHNIGTLAGALYAARTNDGAMRNKTFAALKAIVGTEMGAQEGGQEPSLAVSRKLHSYAIAADVLGYADAGFLAWIRALPAKKLSDGKSVVDVHAKRGNNWGTMAGASRISVALLVNNPDLATAIKVHRGWLGDYAQYAGFDWGATDWQADKAHPVGINKKGATLQVSGGSRNVDGVQPDDQRRTGFQWPPAKGNYPWGALGPLLVTTELLRRAGHPSREWSDGAVLRAVKWLYGPGANPPSGDDGWQPSLLAFLFDGTFAGGTQAVGKTFGFTQWSHAGRKAGAGGTAPEPTPTPPPTGDPCAAQKKKVADAEAALAAAKKALADCQAANP